MTIIFLAQTNSKSGDIPGNIERHKIFIQTAVSHQADFILFPELSLTGYEPTLAQKLAIHRDDARLNPFQALADSHGITISIGVPLQSHAGTTISMCLFQPQIPPRLYDKKFLHVDEDPFFVCGKNFPIFPINQTQIGLAICYEISVPSHAAAAFAHGAQLYAASAVKFVNGIESAHARLAQIARQYKSAVLLSNAVGTADGEMCAGRTAVWSPDGEVIQQLDEFQEGALLFDTQTLDVIKISID